DSQKAVGLGDAGEPGNSVDVDQVRRVREPKLHERYEALAAGEDLGVLAELRQQGRGLTDRARSVILKGGRNHRVVPFQVGQPSLKPIARYRAAPAMSSCRHPGGERSLMARSVRVADRFV